MKKGEKQLKKKEDINVLALKREGYEPYDVNTGTTVTKWQFSSLRYDYDDPKDCREVFKKKGFGIRKIVITQTMDKNEYK